jgi:hypothetical protein
VRAVVWVDSRRRRQITSFAEAGPEDDVFMLDPEDGSVQFGDGVNGRRPPARAQVIVAKYRRRQQR